MIRTACILFTAFGVLGACTQYTDQTSPCFGRDGAAVVTRAAVDLVNQNDTEYAAPKDCQFEELTVAV
jgi:hypothetical protein